MQAASLHARAAPDHQRQREAEHDGGRGPADLDDGGLALWWFVLLWRWVCCLEDYGLMVSLCGGKYSRRAGEQHEEREGRERAPPGRRRRRQRRCSLFPLSPSLLSPRANPLLRSPGPIEARRSAARRRARHCPTGRARSRARASALAARGWGKGCGRERERAALQPLSAKRLASATMNASCAAWAAEGTARARAVPRPAAIATCGVREGMRRERGRRG